MGKVIWTRTARTDLRRVREFVALDSPTAARRIAYAIAAKAKLLEEHPLLGGPIDEENRHGYRQVLYGQYRIIYQIDKNRVLIATIVHSARNFDPDESE